MSGVIPTSEETQIDSCELIFQAMCGITDVKTPEEIVAVVRHNIMLDADCVILIGENIAPEGLITARAIVDWDRDGLSHAEPLPDTIRRLIDEQPLIIPDIDQLDDSLLSVKPYAESVLQAASLIILPLNKHQHVTGYLVLGMHKPHHYDAKQIRHLEILARHIGTVLENRELENILHRQTAQATLARELAYALPEAPDLYALGEIVASKLGQFLPNNHISIALVTPEKLDTEMVVIRGEQMPPHMPLAGSRIKQGVSRKATILFEELAGWADSALWQSIGVHKLIVAPLIANGQILGTLNVGGNTEADLLQEDIPLCEQAATQMAVALQTIWTVKHLKSSLEETTMLYNASVTISAAPNVEEIYTAILQQMAELSNADRITLYLAGPDPHQGIEHIEAIAIYQQNQPTMQSPPNRYLPTQVPVLAQFPQAQSNLIFNDLQTDSRLSVDLRTSYTREGIQALMLIPLSTSAVWLGAIVLESKQRKTFSDAQARLCRSLADQAALGLNTQLLLTRTQQVVGYEQILLNISNRLHSAETIEEIRQIASSEVAIVLGISPEQLAVRGFDANQYPELTHEQREMFNNVRAQVSLASENLNLLEQVKKSAAREQLVSNMTAQLQRATDIDDVLETTVSTLISALDEYDIKVRLLPSEGSRSKGTMEKQ